MQWGDRWYAADDAPTQLEHVPCGAAAEPKLVCGHCSEPLAARETRALPPRELSRSASRSR